MSALAIACGSPPVGQVGVPYSYTPSVSGGTPPYSFVQTASNPVIRCSGIKTGTSSTTVIPLTGLAAPGGGTANAVAGDLAILFELGGYNATIPSGWTSQYQNTGGTWNAFAATRVLTSGDISTGSVTVNFAGWDTGASNDLGIVIMVGATSGVREAQGSFGAGGLGSNLTNTTSGGALSTDVAILMGSVRDSTAVPVITPATGEATTYLTANPFNSAILAGQAMPGGAFAITTFFCAGAGEGCAAIQVILEGVPSTVIPLPPGLALDGTTGIISGTPTTPGIYPVTITVRDSTTCPSATVTCPITIVGPLLISCGSPPSGLVGVPYSQAFPASGGLPPYTFAITSGALPNGLTLNTSTGVASGTPTLAGTFPFTIQVTDAESTNASVRCSITIGGALAVVCDSPPGGTVGTAYSHAFPASGGIPTYTFAITAGSLPTGLTLDPATGIASGTPSVPGLFSFTVQVTDSAAATATVACVINIGSPTTQQVTCSITVNPAPPVGNCCFITRADLRASLQNRLNFAQFWSVAELNVYIQEALTTWQAFARYWRTTDVFNTVVGQFFYDLTDFCPDLAQTATDAQILSTIEYHLIEPQSGIPANPGWYGTEMFPQQAYTDAIERRRARFLLETAAVVRHFPATGGPTFGAVVVSGSPRVTFDSCIIDIRRLAFLDATPAYTVLWRDDEWAATAYDAQWATTTSIPSPLAYSVIVTQPYTAQLLPPPGDAGSLDLLAIIQEQCLNPPVGVVLGIPDNYAWVVKWGAMADLLSQDGPGKDIPRAKYCDQRYREGVQLCRSMPTAINGFINGNAVQFDSVFNLDAFNSSWHNTPGMPTVLAMASQNILATSTVPDAIYGIGLDIVQNCPVLSDDITQITMTVDQADLIVDEAYHLALFKEGGEEFAQSFDLHKNFVKQAALYRQRNLAQAPYWTAMMDIDRLEFTQRMVSLQ